MSVFFLAGEVKRRVLHSAGLEPATFSSAKKCSIQLSYECFGALNDKRTNDKFPD